MRRLAALAIILACAGCTTPGKIATKAPIAVSPTDKTVQAFTECFAPAVTSKWPLTRVIPRQGGQTIYVSAGANGSLAASVEVFTGANGKTVAEMRRGTVFDFALKSITDQFNACL